MQTLVTFLIIWLHTTVSVPLYDSLEPYKSVPEAILYVDGVATYDEFMYYEYEINHTFFSVINTSKVQSYRVDYRVYFPSFSKVSEHSIYFDVVDQTAPTILTSQDIYIPVGQKQYDLLSGLSYKDDYYQNNLLKVEVLQEAAIDYTKVNCYPIIYKVTDPSGNSSYQERNVYVYDHLAPTIEQKEAVIINPNMTIDIYQFFTIKDNYDKVIKVSIIDEEVNYQKVGNYPGVIIASDQSDNEVSLEFDIIIKDMIAPRLVLKEAKINWHLNDEINNEILLSYVSLVSDNYDDLDLADIKIEHLIDINYRGNYEVVYQIEDLARNVTTTKLIVSVDDFASPVIIGPDEIILEVLSFEPHLIDYFTVYDEHCAFELLDIKFSGKVTMSQVGDYRIELTVSDTNKNKAIKQFRVLVSDTTAPTISQNEDILIYDFKAQNVTKYFTIKDNYAKNVLISIDDSLVDYSKTGIYPITIMASDDYQNVAHFNSVIYILDQTVPQIVLATNNIYLEVGSYLTDFSIYIKTVYDGYDKDLTISDVIIDVAVNFNQIGRYIVTYYLADNNGLSTYEELVVYIQDKTAPVISLFKEINLRQNEPLIISNYLVATDDYEGDLTHLINLSSSNFTSSNPGIYELIFTVSDSSGNIALLKAIVTVNKNSVANNFIYLIGGIILIAITAGFLYFNKKQKSVTF